MSLTVDLKTGMVGRSEVFVASLDTALIPVTSVLDLSNLVMPAPGLSAEEMSRLASVDYALQGPVSESALREIAWMFRMKEAEALVQQMERARVGAAAVMGLWETSLGLPAELSSAQPSNSRALAA
jgi:hypothetical protein